MALSRVRTHMAYLTVENDMDTTMDYIIDPVTGSRARIGQSMGMSACG